MPDAVPPGGGLEVGVLVVVAAGTAFRREVTDLVGIARLFPDD